MGKENKINILLIEPDNLMAKIYTDAFNKNNLSVTHVNTAQQAINAVNKYPDLIVLEIQLTEHSGIEFLYELRSYDDLRNIPVIISTIIPLREFKQSLDKMINELNIVEYYQKDSTEISKLIKKINEVINEKRT